MLHLCGLLLGGFGAGSFAMSWALATEPERPASVIAAHIRLQGYRCDQPRWARRDAQTSAPDAPVWIVNCGNARYRLRLVPKQAVDIEPLD
jgi:hypothetical protein